jgi:HJR/Mrr/RecB family endonuclease
MDKRKFSGILKELSQQQFPDSGAEFLADTLQIPMDKAEALVARIKKVSSQTSEEPDIRVLVEKLSEPEPQSSQAGGYSVECLSDKEFGVFMQWLLETLGYEVQGRCAAAWGADLTAIMNGEKIAVLAIKYPQNYALTGAAVLAAQQTQRTQGCNRAIIIATTRFTQQTAAEAQRCGIELWDSGVLAAKIAEAKEKAAQDSQQTSFPPYQGSLLLSLLSLAETKTFLVEAKAEGKYDLLLPGVKYPLLTFEAHGGVVLQCVFRIKYNEPVSEADGEQLVGADETGNRIGPQEAYGLITQYLAQFLE